MAHPSNRKCWTASREIHVGTCADAWEGDVFCVCDPADQDKYDPATPVYVGASIKGVGQPNIKAYLNNVLFDTYYAESSGWVWMWASYDSNGATGTVRFDLCSGDTVLASRATIWGVPEPDPIYSVGDCLERNGVPSMVGQIWKIDDGNYYFHRFDGADFYSGISATEEVFHKVPCPEPCVHGDVNTETCDDGSMVQTHVCIPPDFVAMGDTCETCTRVAAKRTKTCADGTTIATHDCVDGEWVATGAECGEGCVDGTTKMRTCADGSIIVSHECVQGVWYESDNKCPEDPEPECTALETKVCSDGSTIVVKRCIAGKYVPTSNQCPEDPDPQANGSGWIIAGAVLYGLYLYLRG